MRLKKNYKKIQPQDLLGIVIVLCVIIISIFGRSFAPFDPEAINLESRLMPPAFMSGGSSDYLLGTDPMGRDILSRILCGARNSILMGISSGVIALILGTTLGLLAGYYGNLIDGLVMRVVDMMLALPTIMVAIVLVAIIGPHMISVIVAMGLTMWSEYAKIIRAQTLSLREAEFILAAVAIGESKIKIIWKHLVPNLLYIIIVIFSLQIGQIILWAAALSFIGLGGTSISWGWDISAGRKYLSIAWWCITYPGLAIFITVMGFTLLGDWIKSTLDPQAR